MTHDMPVAVISTDFRSASTVWRSHLALSIAEREALFRELAQQGATGFVQLATCNRTAWVAVGDNPAWIGELLRSEALARWLDVAPETPAPPVLHVGEDAVRHLLRVAVGLESFARGERQIAGQVHRAFIAAREQGTACGVTNVLGTVIGRTVARASQLTGFRTGKAGVHIEVASWLGRHVTGRRVLVVGMGHIGRSIAGTLQSDGWKVLRANRTVVEGSGWLALDAIRGGAAPSVDAVVIATGAQRPVWSASDVPKAWRDVPIVDVGSPPQADPSLRDLVNVEVIDLDLLLGVPSHSAEPVALSSAEAEIAAGLAEFRRALGKRQLRDIVHQSRERYEILAWQELPALLERHGLASQSPGRAALEGELRDLFRDYAHAVLDAVERQTTRETS